MDDDVQQFLSKISEEEFQRLGDLIMGNNKMESLQLSCQLVSRHFPHIPELACQQYGSYIHDMLQQSVKHYFANQHSFFGGGEQYTYSINNFFSTVGVIKIKFINKCWSISYPIIFIYL